VDFTRFYGTGAISGMNAIIRAGVAPCDPGNQKRMPVVVVRDWWDDDGNDDDE